MFLLGTCTASEMCRAFDKSPAADGNLWHKRNIARLSGRQVFMTWQFFDSCSHSQAGLYSTVEMIVAPEDRHHCITNEFVNISVLGNDLFYHHIKISIQQFYYGIGCFMLADGCKAANINERCRGLNCFVFH